MSTVEGFRLTRRRFTISPAFEKILSDGTEVAGMIRYLSASTASFGYLAPFDFHHANGLVLMSAGGSLAYPATLSKNNTGIE